VEAKNFYDILGASEDASPNELERLYKRLAKQHHPDRGGDAEAMKAINEAYQVLGNAFTRRAYDSRRKRTEPMSPRITTESTRSTVIPNTVLGRFTMAIFNLMGGLLLLFVISIVYIRFMWPIFLIAVFVVLLGVWKLHEAIVFSRRALPHSHVLRRYSWAQELAFWCMVPLAAYIVYVLITAV